MRLCKAVETIMPYLKRRSTVERKDKKLKKSNNEDLNCVSFMEMLLLECGVSLTDGNSANLIKKEQNDFLKELNRSLTQHSDFPGATEKIIQDLKQHIEPQNKFVRMMLTTNFIKDDQELPHSTQDSVMRLLLKTSPLQTPVAEILIDKMSNFSIDPFYQLSGMPDPINVPQLILSQLRWLDVMNDANLICLKLINAASCMNSEISCSIISSLPEIIGDEVSDDIISKLEGLLSDHLVPILNTIGSLNCSGKALEKFQGLIFRNFISVKKEGYPFAIKYILRTVNEDNVEHVISLLRQFLTFSSSHISQSSNLDLSSQDSIIGCTGMLNAETVLHCAQYLPLVGDTWLKILRHLKRDEFTSVDFIILVLLSSTYNNTLKKSAIAVLKSKVTYGSVNETLIKMAFKESSSVISHYISTLLDFASQFSLSSQSVLRSFGSHLYVCMFSFLDTSCKKYVINSLVQHVGSFSVTEVDSAMMALQDLCSSSLPSLILFADSLKVMMDHIEKMNCGHIRQVYHMLNCVASHPCTKTKSILNEELGELIKKQLSHPTIKVRCIGIIGAVSILKVFGCNENCKVDENCTKANSISKYLLDVASSDYKIAAFYFDELSYVNFNVIDSCLRAKIYSSLKSKLASFILDDEATDGNNAMKASFGLTENTGSVFTVYQSVQNSDSSYCMMCPLLKSLFKVAKKDQEEEVFTYMEFPVQLHHCVFDEKQFKVQTAVEQKCALDGLYVTMNLLREHVNMLSQNKSKASVLLLRTGHITEITAMMESLSKIYPHNYKSPNINMEYSIFGHHKDLNGGSAPGFQVENSDEPTLQSSNASVSAMKKSKILKKKNDNVFSFDCLKLHHLRELSVSCLNVLKVPLSENISNVESESGHKCLTIANALFFLKDIKHKVCYKLLNHNEDRHVPFASMNEHSFQDLKETSESDFGNAACDLIPYLCNHLENLTSTCEAVRSSFLVNIEVGNRQALSYCFESILEVLMLILSWKGLKSEPRTALFIIGKRFSTDLNDHSSLNSIISSCIGYLKNFETTVEKLSLQAAVFLIKTMESVSKFCDPCERVGDVSSKIHHSSTKMLIFDWSGSTSSTTGKQNDLLATLLKCNVQTSIDTAKRVAHFVDEGLCKLNDDEKQYPNFQKGNSHVVYSCLLAIIAEETSKIPICKSKDNESTCIEILLKWNDYMKVVGVIVKLLRELHSRLNILSSLKMGRIIIENFIKTGIPTCEKLFQLYQDDIFGTLKHLQLTTRQLQHLTCHSKVIKDVTLAKHVPPLKKCLETLLFRVKGMLALHNCQNAFWLGNLKNRNLQGDEILSQLSQPRQSQDFDTDYDYENMSYSEGY